MLTQTLRSLSHLPFAEMMALSEHIAGEIRHLQQVGGFDTITPELIAQILAKAAANNKPAVQAEAQEKEILLQAFTRKRQVNIKKFNTGYAIEVPTLPGSTVTGTDLRAMFGQMIDQIVTMEALGGGSTRGR